MRLPDYVRTIVQLYRDAGYEPEITQGRKCHYKVRAPGAPLVVCGSTISDARGERNAIAMARRVLRTK